MASPDADKVFSGSIAKLYEEHLVPLIFAPYAEDLTSRLASRSPARVLEVAAGTGVVTANLRPLPAGVSIIATDLNQAMLDMASEVGRVALCNGARQTPCNFPSQTGIRRRGVSVRRHVLPDKAKGFAEARRVLKEGGVFLFNVWDRIEENEFANTVTTALESIFPDDPPRFMARIPHGYHQLATIERDLASGGFVAPRIDTVAAHSRATTPRVPAIAYCQGTPLRNEIEARDKSRLAEATDIAEDAFLQFGPGPVDGKIQAHVVTVER
jgi:ubiquinone/menaquinone biosynthesis C-methylase UbiE